MTPSPPPRNPLLPVMAGRAGSGVMRTEELSVLLTSCCTLESRPCTHQTIIVGRGHRLSGHQGHEHGSTGPTTCLSCDGVSEGDMPLAN